MRKFLFLIFAISFFVHSTGVNAQKISVKAQLDSAVLRIGDQAHLSFTVSQQPNQKVILPVFSDKIGGLELVEPAKTDTVKKDNGTWLVNERCVVTAFDDSIVVVPPFPFIANGDTVWSDSLSIKVVQPFKIDTASQTITDIKSVMDVPFDWWGFFKIVLIVWLICCVLVIAYLIYRKYFRKKPVLDVKSQELLLPPHVVALSYLDKIKQEKAWQQGRSKVYHTQLTEVIREYIERMYNMNSMEMTSEEILEQFRYMRLEDKSVYLSLQQILRLADLVKFAKWDATPDEHELSLMNAYLFVNQTKVEEVKPLESN